jgi:fatty-acid desaturase
MVRPWPGWHNGYNAAPRSYRHGLAEGQIDINGWIIDRLERFGWAGDVVRVDPNALKTN